HFRSVPLADQVHRSKTACLLGGLLNLHNPRQSDCKSRAAAGLACDRNIVAHHLTEAPVPRPVPPYLLAVVEDACENSWNSLPISSGVIPMPVSATEMLMPPSSCRASMAIMPRSVNLLALLMRLSNAWRRRIWSACMVPISPSQWTATLFPFFATSGSMVLTTS